MTSNTLSEQKRVPQTMQALHLPPGPYNKEHMPMSSSSLIYRVDAPVPIPSARQYLIKVQAATVLAGEVQAQLLRASSSSNSSNGSINLHGHIPGREFSGKIISTPQQDYAKSTGPAYKVNDQVFGLLDTEQNGNGAAADYVLATENELAWKPQNVSAAEAATIPLPALTAWQGLFSYATLDPDDGPCNRPADGPLRVLVTNAAGSEVGRQAMRLLQSRALFPDHKSHVMGGGDEKEKPVWICATGARDDHGYLCGELGADAVTSGTDIAAAFRENGWDPVDIVFDCIAAGGASLRQVHSPVVVKDHGHVITPYRCPSAHPEKPAEREEKAEIRTRNLTSKVINVKPDVKQLAKIAELVEKGVLKPAGFLQVEDLLHGREALIQAEQISGSQGQVVLRVDPAMD
ncbi:putative zinc-binding oxidoreductase [Talaromyces proteolyticus]|uniref:Zinc-binding oxidoreductase n=1 Tax=Talaromyces proteolyticus TaxID=1131652 RepID=A0AAD4KQZ4_9EURO|nr:putative zinc-binding oxidoreductase [Talaromyces proteolyticus]KAH8697123.1 putative zinc-binding oxidoreductase [Talaromyces proteolyticus]